MATFDDFKRVIKDAIEVDFKDRWTNQVVRFINKNNEYYGTIKDGIIHAKELSAHGAFIDHSILSCCTMYDENGNVVDVGKLIEQQKRILITIDTLSTDFREAIKDINEQIENLGLDLVEYVNDVSARLSTAFDEKIAQSGEQQIYTLSSISSYLQEQIISNDYDISSLNKNLFELSSKIKTGLVYKGQLTDKGEKVVGSFANLFKINYVTGNLYTGWMYSFKGDVYVKREESEKPIHLLNGDYLIVNSDISVEEADETTIDVIDSQDKDLVHYGDLARISSLLSTDLSTLRDDFCDLSSKVYNLNGTFNVDSENGLSVVTKITQREGKIEIESRRILSDDISGFDEFVRNEIALSVNSLDSSNGKNGQFIVSVLQENGILSASNSKVTNDFINENSISQSKITDLTSDLYNISSEISTIARRNRGDVSWMGDLLWARTITDTIPFRNFLMVAMESHDNELKKGFLYRCIADQDVSCDLGTMNLGVNDYMLVNEDVSISNADFNSFRYIRDYDKEIKEISDDTNNISVELSNLREYQNQICSSISVTVDNRFNDLCASISSIVKNDYFKLNEYNEIKSNNKFNCTQVFENISSYNISVDYSRFYDSMTKKLSDVVDIGNTFGELYNALSEIKTRAFLSTDFIMTQSIEQTVNTINGYANELNVLIEPLTQQSRVIDCFNAVVKIVNDSDIQISTNLRDVLNEIDARFDIVEKSFADLAMHYNRTFEKDYKITSGEDAYVDLLKVTDEVKGSDVQYTLHLMDGTLVLVPVEK